MTIESDPDYTQFEVEARQYVADGSTPQRPERNHTGRPLSSGSRRPFVCPSRAGDAGLSGRARVPRP